MQGVQSPAPQIRGRSMEAEILHGPRSSRRSSFSPARAFQEKCTSTEPGITSEGGSSKLFLQPLRIPGGGGKDSAVPACRQSRASSSRQLPPSEPAASFVHRGCREPPRQGS